MSESEQSEQHAQKGHWRSLLEALGMPVPEEPEAAPEEESMLASEAALPADAGAEAAAEPMVESQPRTPRPEHQRPPSDWYALANQLGIEVEPPPPEEPPVVEPVVAQETAASETEVIAAETKVDDAATPADTLREEGSESFIEFEQEEVFELEVSGFDDVDFGDDQSTFSQVVAMDEVAESLTEESDEEEDEETLEAQPAEPSRRRRRRGRRRGGADRQRGRQRGEEEDEGELEEELTGDMEESEVSEPDEQAEETDEATGTPSRRSRRRRKRGTRRDTQKAQDQDENDQEERDEDDRDVEADEDIEAEQVGSRSGKSTGGRTKHHKIPTWEEAISLLVTSNMQSRSRSSASRGKSRGPRRRRS